MYYVFLLLDVESLISISQFMLFLMKIFLGIKTGLIVDL